MAQAGAARKIKAVTGQEAAGPAIPAAKQTAPNKIQAGPALAVQIVDDAYIATHGLQAGKSIPVYQVTTGKVEAGPVVPVYLTEGGVTAPVADFSANDTTPAVDQLVTFTDLSTNTPTSWDWDFGDGTAHSTSQNPTHTYTEIGTFTVTLIATNAAGSDTEMKVSYIVATPYTLSFTGLSAFPALWTATTWTVSANTAKNTPTEGPGELLTDPGLEAWTSATNLTSWSEVKAGTSTINQEAVVIHGGSNAARLDVDASTNSAGIQQQVTAAAGAWLKFSAWLRSNPTGKAARLFITADQEQALTTTYAQFAAVQRVSAANPNVLVNRGVPSASSSIYVDDVSCKLLSGLIAYRDFGRNDVIVKAAWTIAANRQAGVVALSDGTLNNCLVANYNRHLGTAILLQYVAGSPTQLISATIAYSAGADVEIRVSSNGAVAGLYYNGSQVGVNQVPNAAIRANTKAGLFSTDVSSTCASFSVVAN